MTTTANSASPGPLDLLKTLGGTGSAARARAYAEPDRLSTGELTRTGTFAELLAKARSGEIQSNVPITIARNSGVELSPDQLQRLSVAADMAQSAGATRCLVHIDGQSLMLDVGARQITGKASASPGEVITGIDAVLEVPAAPGTPTLGANKPRTPAIPMGISPSLLEALTAAS